MVKKEQIVMSLSTLVKSIQDIMRQDAGVDGDAQRISQLVWMLFMKIFDDKELEYELESEYYRSPVPERLRWRNWAADDEGITGDLLLDFINSDLFKTLKELEVDLSSDPKAFLVKGIFSDSYNYMKSGTLIRQVVNKINQLDFNNLKDRHLFNEIYEKILKDLQSAGNAGEYYTPRAVTQFMADMVNPQLGETVLDPACGTGGFLVCALDNMRKQAKSAEDWKVLSRSIMGIEKKPLPHLLSVTNLILHDIEVPNIFRDNSLSRRPLRDYGESDRVDVILTNPPFGGTEEPGVENNFPAAYRTRETADLFLLLIIKLLKDGGRAAIVLPDGFLFGEGVKTRIKEHLLERCNLHTIVRLPNGVFNPYTGIKTNLLFFSKGEPTSEVWYYEHPYPEGYKSYSKTKPMRIEEFEPEKAWWENREENERAWKVSLKDIKDRNYNLDISNPNSPDEDHGDPVELLQKYQYLQYDIQQTREVLKNELMASLGGKAK
jgi:type I restriction enzyme M protein